MRTNLLHHSGLAACLLLAAGGARAQEAELPKGAVARFGDATFHCESIVVSPTRKVAALNGKGPRPVFVELATGKRLTQFDYLDNPFLAAFASEGSDAYAFSPDGKTVLVYLNRAMVLLNVETGKVVWRAAVDGRPRSAALSRDGKRFACGFAGFRTRSSAAVFDMEKGERIFRVEPVGQGHTEVALSDDGQLLAVRGGEEGRRLGPDQDSPFAGQVLQLWQVGAAKEKDRLVGDFPKNLCFAPDGKSIAFSTQRDARSGVAICSVADLKVRPLTVPKVENFIPVALAYAPDGKKLACGDTYGRIVVWDAATGATIAEHRAPPGRLRSVDFGGRLLATGKREGCSWIWDAAAGKLVSTMVGNVGPVESLVWSKDGKRLRTASQSDRRICDWERATGKLQTVDLAPAHPEDDFYWTHYGMSVSPDGKTATGFDANDYGEAKLSVWDAVTGKYLKATPIAPARVRVYPFWSPDRSLIALRSDKGIFLRRTDGADVQVLELAGDAGATNLEVAISHDNKLVAAVLGKSIRAWDIAAKKVIWTAETAKQHYGPTPLRFSADGKSLYLADSSTPQIAVFDAATGKETRKLTAAKTNIGAMAVAPKSNRIATAWRQGSKQFVEVFDGDTGRSLRQFASPQSGVIALAFSPDDALLASGGWDTTVYLWDVAAK